MDGLGHKRLHIPRSSRTRSECCRTPTEVLWSRLNPQRQRTLFAKRLEQPVTLPRAFPQPAEQSQPVSVDECLPLRCPRLHSGDVLPARTLLADAPRPAIGSEMICRGA